MGKIAFGYAHLHISNTPKILTPNALTQDRVQELAFKEMVLSSDRQGIPQRSFAQATPYFDRPSKLRYEKDTLLKMGRVGVQLGQVYNSNYNVWFLPTGVGQDQWNSDVRFPRNTEGSPTILTSQVSMAVGCISCGMGAPSNSSLPTNVATPGAQYLPASWYEGHPALTLVDLPGTRIGNIFKHPTGRSAYFNETGQTSLSQGSIELEGNYDPDENMLGHRGFRVYHAKAGGTGKPSGTSGSNGSVTTSSDNFVDGAAGSPFVIGDVGRYIRVRTPTANGVNVGVFLITAFVDANTVTVDAAAINQAFTTEAGMTWELVDGPIGEYFFQRRHYTHGSDWSSTVSSAYTLSPAGTMTESFPEVLDQDSPVTQTIYDRGACWWWISHMPEGDDAYKLMRWKHMSVQGYDPVYKDGDITNMPTGITNWRSIAIDSDNKLWIAWAAGANDGSNIAKIDPYPAGDARNPDALLTVSEQASDSDVAGVVTTNITGIVIDTSQAYAAGDRVWVLGRQGSGAVADRTDGGLSYSDDGGTTWKRVHHLHSRTGTASVSNGTTEVTGVGTSFDTEFAVGDWIRFAGAGRSYEIASITDADTLDLVINHVSGESGVVIEKGAFSSAQARMILEDTNGGNGSTARQPGSPPCDFDGNGNLFWINEARDRVVKWDPGTGLATDVTVAQMSTTVAMDAEITSLTVHRIPDPSGLGPHTLHNRIWVCHRDSGLALLDEVFDGTHVRYHWTLSDNFAGGTMDMVTATGIHYNPRVIVEPKTGQAFIFGTYAAGSHDNVYQYTVHQNAVNIGELIDNNIHTTLTLTDLTQLVTYKNWNFDDVGMGCGVWPVIETQETIAQAKFAVVSPCWICFRWNGTAWVEGGVNQAHTNIDFAGTVNTPVGPYVDFPVAPGTGSRRMHPDFDDLSEGIRVRFADAGGATNQSDEFLIDETSTFVCYLGAGKDNIQEASWAIDVWSAPTVHRLDEPIKDMENQWTQDGGIDGGYVNSASEASFPLFSRGFAENTQWENGGFTGAPYQDTTNHLFNNPTDSHVMAALRILDEGEFAADGSTSIGSDVFTTAGAHTFVPGDVGKSIIIEGVNGATPDVDNGQAVITSFTSGTQVQVDKTFAATNAGLRWKLRDIPAVKRVQWHLPFQNDGLQFMHREEYKLFSSNDLGVTWTQVKFIDDTEGLAEHEGNRQDTGAWLSHWPVNALRQNFVSSSPNGSSVVIFDLGDLPENIRRRQYWKVKRNNVVNSGSIIYTGNVILFDENGLIMGRPANCHATDAIDPLFTRIVVHEARLVPYEGSTNITSIDDDDGDGFTNLASAPGENFYETTGSNNATLTVGGNFQGPASTFAPTDVGKFLRVSNAANTSNDGFAIITAVVSDSEVVTDQVFTAEANTFDWQILVFGENDLLRIDDETIFVKSLGTVLKDTEFVISDVPSNTTILMASKNLPLEVISLPFTIDRAAPDAWTSGFMGQGGTNLESLQRLAYDGVTGTSGFTDPLEFTELSMDASATANSAADTDGDARVQQVVLTATDLNNNFLESQVAAGDYLQLEASPMGRRVFEILSVTRDSPVAGQTTIVVTYDEIHPSTSYPWRIMRKRGGRFAWRRAVVSLRETP